MKRIYAFVLALVILAVVMTIGAWVTAGGPGAEPRDFKIWEIPGAPPPPRYDRIRFGVSGEWEGWSVPTPYRMRDWAQCMDGQQFYDQSLSREPQLYNAPNPNPCLGHGGVRARGPGNRLNERQHLGD